MKKITVMVALAAISIGMTPIVAQNSQQENPHELRLGFGAVLSPSFGYTNDVGYYAPTGYYGYYKGDLIGTPSINLSYSYRFKKWFSFGATLAYSGMSQNSYDLYLNSMYMKDNEHFISITPTVRIDWMQTKMVKLYSSVGIGLGLYIERNNMIHQGRTEYRTGVIPTIDFNPIGISVGKKLFGFCEVGLSSIGFAKVGIGYRFNYKSKK